MSRDQPPPDFTPDELELLASSTDDLEARTGVMSFDINRLVARLRGEKWQQVLQAHLYFDHVITAVLREELRHPDAIDIKRMGFSQKMQMISAMGLVPTAFIPPVSYVNKLRNRLAHDLEAVISDDEIQNLKNALPKWFREKTMTPEELEGDDSLLNMLVFLLTYLDSVRQRNSLRRLQQQKAYLNARRVLYYPDAPYEP